MYTKFGCKIDRVYSYTNIPKENLKFSKGTEVLVPRVGEDPMDYNHCTWLSLANVAIGEMISVYNTEQNPLFTAIMFNATLKYEFAKRVEGGSVTNLYYEKLLEIPVSFPNIEEQKKIASLFENFDHLITLHQRKCDTLQKLKKSMLQKMFPKNDSLYPEIRFEGFTDAWEQRKLGDIVTVYDGVHQTPNYQTSGIMFLSVENIATLKSNKFISIEDFKRDYKVYPQRNDILMTRIGDVGTTNVVTDNDVKAYYVSLALLKYKETNPFFLSSAIQSDFVQKGLSNRTLKTAIPMKINKDEIGQVDVMLPTSEDEQDKIGSFFRNLDSLITLHQRKPFRRC